MTLVKRSAKMSPYEVNREEQKRLMVLTPVGEERVGAREAVVGLGLSLRHVRRLLARFRKEGA
jgi:hypothetical protein